jgi:hypothetical protein
VFRCCPSLGLSSQRDRDRAAFFEVVVSRRRHFVSIFFHIRTVPSPPRLLSSLYAKQGSRPQVVGGMPLSNALIPEWSSTGRGRILAYRMASLVRRRGAAPNIIERQLGTSAVNRSTLNRWLCSEMCYAPSTRWSAVPFPITGFSRISEAEVWAWTSVQKTFGWGVM